MIHPLLRLVVTQPHLLADHAGAYADLVGGEAARTAKAYAIRAAAGLLAFVLAIIFLILAGVALIFWAVTPASNIQAPWALIVGPAVPAILAVVAVLVALKETESPFAEIKQQVAADLSMLRQVSSV